MEIVYLLGSETSHTITKIGRTKYSADVRCTEFNKNTRPEYAKYSRYTVYMEYKVVDCVEVEARLHELFYHYRIRGTELFKVAPKVVHKLMVESDGSYGVLPRLSEIDSELKRLAVEFSRKKMTIETSEKFDTEYTADQILDALVIVNYEWNIRRKIVYGDTFKDYLMDIRSIYYDDEYVEDLKIGFRKAIGSNKFNNSIKELMEKNREAALLLRNERLELLLSHKLQEAV